MRTGGGEPRWGCNPLPASEGGGSRRSRCLLHRSHVHLFRMHLASLALLHLHLVSFAPSLRLRSLFFVLFGVPLASFAPPAWPEIIFTPSLEVPPGAAHSARTPPEAHNRPLENQSVFRLVLGSLFDRFGNVLDRHLGSFWALWAAKLGRVRSQTRVESLSLSKK